MINVSLTVKGREEAEDLIGQFLGHVCKLGSGLTPADIERLDSICHTLLKPADDEN